MDREQRKEERMKVISIQELEKGMMICEQDGCFFEVGSIEEVGKKLRIELINVNGYMISPDPVLVSKNSRVRVL